MLLAAGFILPKMLPLLPPYLFWLVNAADIRNEPDIGWSPLRRSGWLHAAMKQEPAGTVGQRRVHHEPDAAVPSHFLPALGLSPTPEI